MEHFLQELPYGHFWVLFLSVTVGLGRQSGKKKKSPCTTIDPTKLPLSCLAEHLSPVCFLPPKSTWVTLSHHTPWCSWGHGVPVPSVSETFSPSIQDEIRHLLKETDIDVSPAPCFELWAMKCQMKVLPLLLMESSVPLCPLQCLIAFDLSHLLMTFVK